MNWIASASGSGKSYPMIRNAGKFKIPLFFELDNGFNSMNDKMEEFLLSCSRVDFGTINLSKGEKNFCSELNDEIHSLCKSLPPSTQTQALLLLMKYFKNSLGGEFSFFMNYYAPAWSIIYWLIQPRPGCSGLSPKDIANAKTAHSMALLLHPLDDHLCDGQLPVTHLNLLMRSQAWMMMNSSMRSLAENLVDGNQIVEGFIDDYYSGINSTEDISSLDGYVDLFRKQMATGFVVPVLLSKKITTDRQFAAAIQSVYGSFGIAWRLLDDVNDIKIDVIQGNKSAVYTCLPDSLRKCWGKDSNEKSSGDTGSILNYVVESGIAEKIVDRIRIELESGAATAEGYHLTNLADELRCLAKPLHQRQNPL